MKSKTEVSPKINTAYVFSENNQVYLKRSIRDKSTNSHSVHTEKWLPISFCWKP
ncbi:hypothetical protein [Aquimarina sp. 2201CG5-10]|uniref:hypothetical protein n=1 Tax=Aquimarina callyspongiae TaxID=3098150 RepID=UPI002AB3F1ED|nr:hypothetical protein [Aquimarina sp. 2201CG5-10]MDY8138306.1 hypothetical protein [Aquimarina sp. 2201CG5-10]